MSKGEPIGPRPRAVFCPNRPAAGHLSPIAPRSTELPRTDRVTAMNHHLLPLLAAGLAAGAVAQGPAALFTTNLPEQTLSGSGGTVLQTLWPNEVASIDFFPCPVISAEKWAPRSCYHTMAGDDNSNTQYWNPAMFGTIDALC